MIDQLRWEVSPRWVRGRAGDTTVVDSRRAILLWVPGEVVPMYAFPDADVRTDLLRPRPGGTGYDLVLDGEVRPEAAWRLEDEGLSGYLAFAWFGRSGRGLDHWYEESEEIFVHPRDPYKRVDAIRSTRHVTVAIDGTVVADSRRPVLVFETHLPVRYYLPREDVRLDLFAHTDLQTGCPYKGTAEYWTYPGRDNIAWSYPEPLPAVPAITGLISFYNEVVDITVDGELLDRPVTPFSAQLAS
ncbi:DUF427 domain-containing protein [Paractinoplanes rishiriensis]|uniref:DUF427 domain-containing protein n=1 Tax=Paractinoplanes rishiriensis TaxID=1050105 RepID=A0A919N2F1_9ACTN|nr:DUF427 domain-containing protein [Actinoplanes rishiriensis]GIE99802.1 hypothetical protein Ari01nite_72670 [Actinoplanes rishiriensis]